ncbi:fasciclin domain-containing protein [Mucilaginibacter dorajii]|uniref:Fasciclin domain-containing protein n=2 Tax=Mucilaginibacter dorajii TaxID=692994 RepID=A0ABP7QRH0_9SPHI
MLFAQGKAVNPKAIGQLKITAGDGMLAGNDIVKNIALSKELSTFYNLINESNLAVTLQSRGPITIFVPANPSFQNLPKGKLDSLGKPTHLWELTSIVSYHAIPGSLKAKDIEKEINKGKGLATFTTLSGNKLMARIDANRNIVLVDENGGESIISRFDVEQSNGMLHVVNKVLIPKAKVI